MTTKYGNSQKAAMELDEKDPLRKYRAQFHIPKTKSGKEFVYLAGNSLGLQPRKVKTYIKQELIDWAKLGVEGHFHAKHPWMPYHENVTDMTARLVGAKPSEVVVMNTLTVNLHLMLVSFYRPKPNRFRIIVEAGAFPSDQYAVKSHILNHGYQPGYALVELKPREGESTLRTEDILATIEKEKSQLALVLLGNVNYLTGQAFDVKTITEAGHKAGAMVGFDFAHGAGNLLLKLHDWDVDFAVWCSYKYLNAGPGGLSGCFVHERHGKNEKIPRLAGWWGHDKETRFKMPSEFKPIEGAEGWQLSNPPIFQLAALRASLEIFDEAGMEAIRAKGDKLTGFLEFLLDTTCSDFCTIVTPREVKDRGCQLSLRIKGASKDVLKTFQESGIICDFREPDIIRVAPAPLYNSYSDVYHFVKTLGEYGNR